MKDTMKFTNDTPDHVWIISERQFCISESFANCEGRDYDDTAEAWLKTNDPEYMARLQPLIDRHEQWHPNFNN